MNKAKKIYEALLSLDPEKDSDWTADRLPKIDVLAKKVGAPVTRAELRDLTKNFTRDNPTLEDNFRNLNGVQGEIVDDGEDIGSEQALESAKVELEAKRKILGEAQVAFDNAARKVDNELARMEVDKMGNKLTEAEEIRRFQKSQLIGRGGRDDSIPEVTSDDLPNGESTDTDTTMGSTVETPSDLV